MNGPGKYDDLCTHVREAAKAQGAVVIIINGEHGQGFSVQGDIATLLHLPDMLDQVSAQIRRDLKVNARIHQ